MNFELILKEKDFNQVVKLIKQVIDDCAGTILPDDLNLSFRWTRKEDIEGEELKGSKGIDNISTLFYDLSSELGSSVIGFRVIEKGSTITIQLLKALQKYDFKDEYYTTNIYYGDTLTAKDFEPININVQDILADNGEVELTSILNRTLENYFSKLIQKISLEVASLNKAREIEKEHKNRQSNASLKILKIIESDDFVKATKKAVKTIKKDPELVDTILGFAESNKSTSASFYENVVDMIQTYISDGFDEQYGSYIGKETFKKIVVVAKKVLDLIYNYMPEGSTKIELKDLFMALRKVNPAKYKTTGELAFEGVSKKMFNRLVEEEEAKLTTYYTMLMVSESLKGTDWDVIQHEDIYYLKNLESEEVCYIDVYDQDNFIDVFVSLNDSTNPISEPYNWIYDSKEDLVDSFADDFLDVIENE